MRPHDSSCQRESTVRTSMKKKTKGADWEFQMQEKLVAFSGFYMREKHKQNLSVWGRGGICRIPGGSD